MCGIVGFITSQSDHSSNNTLQRMVDSLKHRGPDQEGMWSDDTACVFMGHRRLSIRDLSVASNQPMISRSGRFVLSYNGEIYNADNLRSALIKQGIHFRTTSDTEVLLEAISKYGLIEAIKKINGMFSFALWDKRDKTLILARDRIGIKPLYWGQFNNIFLFASELKALRLYPAWRPQICNNSVLLYTNYGYIPSPYSIYQDIYKLNPGCILTKKQGLEPVIDKYWNLNEIVTDGMKDRRSLTDKNIINETEKLLSESINSQTISDVPVGAFLSGGIDSSTVVALMQKNSLKKLELSV